MGRKPPDARQAALLVLLAVLRDGLTLDAALTRHLPGLDDTRDQALAQRLAYGVLRHYHPLDHLAERLLRKPLEDKHQDLQLCLLLGLEQLWHLQTPAHAAIHATVDLARRQRKNWAAGMLNAVLRRFQREHEALLKSLPDDPVLRYACPEWLLERWRTDWPADWQRIADASLQPPPMWLRVNLARTNREQYLQTLHQHQLAGEPGSGAADVCLQQPCPVQQLPGFDQGLVSVQDAAAQCAVPLLELSDNLRVLDACAAPGGKTSQILENNPHLTGLTALDVSAARSQKIADNLERLGLKCELLCADAQHTDAWWDGEPYDRILLDAPCSASGVIRRHPDIKHRLQPDDIAGLADVQGRLLDRLWSVLRPGGMLVYVTCSVFNQENQAVIKAFTEHRKDARIVPLELPLGRPAADGWQILPGDGNADGLFFARLRKYV